MKYMSVVILHIAHMFNFCTQKCTLKIEYSAVPAAEPIYFCIQMNSKFI